MFGKKRKKKEVSGFATIFERWEDARLLEDFWRENNPKLTFAEKHHTHLANVGEFIWFYWLASVCSTRVHCTRRLYSNPVWAALKFLCLEHLIAGKSEHANNWIECVHIHRGPEALFFWIVYNVQYHAIV